MRVKGAVEFKAAAGDLGPGEILFDVAAGGGAHALGEGGLLQEKFDAGAEGFGVVRGDDEAGFGIEDEFGEAGGLGDDDGFGAGHGFEGDEAEEFGFVVVGVEAGEGGLEDDVGTGVLAAEFGIVGVEDEEDVFAGGGALELFGVGVVVGAADDVERGVGAEGVDEFEDAFVREEAADEEGVAAGRFGGGGELGEVDAAVEERAGLGPVVEETRGVAGEEREAVRAAVEIKGAVEFAQVSAPAGAAAADVGEDDFLAAQFCRADEEVGGGGGENHRVQEIERSGGAEAGAGEGEEAALVKVADGEGLDGEAAEGFAGGRGVEEGERGGGEVGEGAGVLKGVAFAAADGAVAGKVGGGEDEDAGLGGAHLFRAGSGPQRNAGRGGAERQPKRSGWGGKGGCKTLTASAVST